MGEIPRPRFLIGRLVGWPMNTIYSHRLSLLATQRGFTLLESIIALTVLSAVIVVCLQLRSHSLARSRAVYQRGAEIQAMNNLLELAASNLLANPQGPTAGDPTRRIQWQGQYLGQPFSCDRQRVTVPNPLANSRTDPDAMKLAPQVQLYQFTLTYADNTAQFYRTLSR